MSERQRLAWRLMGVEKRSSGQLVPGPRREKEKSAAEPESGTGGGVTLPQIPDVEEMEIPHLAGSGLFSRADQPPPVEDLAGETRGEKLKALSDWLGDCTRCPLHAGRNMVVFGETNPDASLVFVGEGPGADEDASGRPFVGRAGQLLTKMIEAMSLRREDVYICNVVKCRPPGNRAPNADEEAICGPVMYRQLEIIRPELIIALGAPAMHALLERKDGITKMRGRLFRYGDSLVLPTFHPAYLLRSPSQKKLVWEDLKLACAVLGLKPRPKQG